MDTTALQSQIEALWQGRDRVNPGTGGADRAAIEDGRMAFDAAAAEATLRHTGVTAFT